MQVKSSEAAMQHAFEKFEALEKQWQSQQARAQPACTLVHSAVSQGTKVCRTASVCVGRGVCMCVCMCDCLHVCLCACVHACLCACVRACLCVRACVRVPMLRQLGRGRCAAEQ